MKKLLLFLTLLSTLSIAKEKKNSVSLNGEYSFYIKQVEAKLTYESKDIGNTGLMSF